MIFPTDPGSYASVTAGFRRTDTSLIGLAGSNVGADACARICPVFGSITTTVPEIACAFFTAADIASCATHCTSRSIVSCTPVPGFASVMISFDPGITVPAPLAKR